MLEVAKSLLTMPEQSVLTIFGISELEICGSLPRLQQPSRPHKQQQLVPLYYEKTRLRGC
jgi:hypothetical protein